MLNRAYCGFPNADGGPTGDIDDVIYVSGDLGFVGKIHSNEDYAFITSCGFEADGGNLSDMKANPCVVNFRANGFFIFNHFFLPSISIGKPGTYPAGFFELRSSASSGLPRWRACQRIWHLRGCWM